MCSRVEGDRVGSRKNNAKMTTSMIGHSQFRHVGGGGGADGAALSPGGGGFACLLMAAPCDAQYARYPVQIDQPDGLFGVWSAHSRRTIRKPYGTSTAAPSKRPAFRSRWAWSVGSSGYGRMVSCSW